MKTSASVISLLICIAVSFIPALVGSQFIPGEWYAQLQKPSWTPPGYLFGPVWTLLYVAMGVAIWLVFRRTGFTGARLALTLFVAQLILNGMWSWIFFGMQEPGLAFAEILVLWLVILMTMMAFLRVSTAAGILFVPYLAWVSFAAILNFSIWRMNKGS